MSKRRDGDYLKDIMEAIKRIKTYSDKMDYDEFLGDIKTQDAVVRNIEIIGEAVKNISPDLKDRYETIEWKKIAGMRDKIIHFYFGINWDIVWDVITNRLPLLEDKIKKLIEKEFRI